MLPAGSSSPKKSPLLIGEAGVGKTSVVEGLAYRLQRGTVPDLLKNKKKTDIYISVFNNDKTKNSKKIESIDIHRIILVSYP